jgi:hypothetical protein
VFFSSLFSHAFAINFQDGIKARRRVQLACITRRRKTDCFCKAAAYKTIMINQMRSIEAKNYNEYWVGGGGGDS